MITIVDEDTRSQTVVGSISRKYFLFNRGLAKKGERVLIHGASGAVGLAAIQIAKNHGEFNFDKLHYFNFGMFQ